MTMIFEYFSLLKMWIVCSPVMFVTTTETFIFLLRDLKTIEWSFKFRFKVTSINPSSEFCAASFLGSHGTYVQCHSRLSNVIIGHLLLIRSSNYGKCIIVKFPSLFLFYLTFSSSIFVLQGIVNNNKDCGGNGIRPMDLPPASTAGAPSVVTTTTPISTRHPSEDATLEYAAYDNPGMTPSPVLAENRGETSF